MGHTHNCTFFDEAYLIDPYLKQVFSYQLEKVKR